MMKKLFITAIAVITVIITVGVFISVVRGEEITVDMEVARVLSAAYNCLCQVQNDGMDNNNYNQLLESLRKIKSREDLSNSIRADAIKYIGVFFASYTSTEGQGIALFKEAIKLNPLVELCPESHKFSLFLQVYNAMLDSTGPTVKILAGKYDSSQKSISMEIGFSELGSTPYSGPQKVVLFYRLDGGNWVEDAAIVSLSKNRTTGSMVFHVPVSGADVIVQYYITVEDHLTNISYWGTKDHHFEFKAKDGPMKAVLVKADPKVESEDEEQNYNNDKEDSWVISTKEEDKLCGDSSQGLEVKMGCDFFCRGIQTNDPIENLASLLLERTKKEKISNEEIADLYKYLASVSAITAMSKSQSENDRAGAAKARDRFLELAISKNPLVFLCPNSPAFTPFQTLLQKKDKIGIGPLPQILDKRLINTNSNLVLKIGVTGNKITGLSRPKEVVINYTLLGGIGEAGPEIKKFADFEEEKGGLLIYRVEVSVGGYREIRFSITATDYLGNQMMLLEEDGSVKEVVLKIANQSSSLSSNNSREKNESSNIVKEEKEEDDNNNFKIDFLLFPRVELGRIGLVHVGAGADCYYQNFPVGLKLWGSGGGTFITGKSHPGRSSVSWGADLVVDLVPEQWQIIGGYVSEMLSFKGWQVVERVRGGGLGIIDKLQFHQQKRGMFFGLRGIIGRYDDYHRDVNGFAWAGEISVGFIF